MVAKKTATKAKTAKTAAKKPSTAKKASTRSRVSTAPAKVDYYPNRMTFAISALAGTILVLISVIVAVNQ